MATTKINVRALRRLMALRGMNGSELAVLSKLSPSTVSHALQGVPVANRTLRQLAQALTAVPEIPAAVALLEDGDGGMAESG